MKTIAVRTARAQLEKLLDQIAMSHDAVRIKGRRTQAILISEDDWRSIQETLHLLSVPGMRKLVRSGLKTPVEKCKHQLAW